VQLLEELRTAVLRGNPGEISALHGALCTTTTAGGQSRETEGGAFVRGVDSAGSLSNAHSVVTALAQAKHTVVAMTGILSLSCSSAQPTH
jgi:hydroxyethylthiazole kinase-like sugar kinase family protein